MKARNWRIATAAWLLLAAAPLAFADDTAKKEQPATDMSPEAIQAFMEKYAMPGPEHAWFAFFEGDWTFESTMWMAPGAESMSSGGKVSFEPMLGGRYLMGRFEGNFMGQPFHGVDMSGYDRVAREYFSIWFDTAGTGYMLATGALSEDGKRLTTGGTMKDPMSGDTMTHRSVQTVTGDDTFVLEMWQKIGEGPEYRSMEVRYTRAGARAAKQ